jgi:hypothetical protein
VETKTLQTSTILIATGGRTRLFRSKAELPAEMRSKLKKAMHAPGAGTILIADQRGRKEILKLLRGEPSVLRSAGPSSIRNRMPAKTERRLVQARTTVKMPNWLRPRWVRATIAFLLPAAIGAGFYALLTAGR